MIATNVEENKRDTLFSYYYYYYYYYYYTGRKPGTGCAHSKIARVARVVFVLYVVGRAY